MMYTFGSLALLLVVFVGLIALNWHRLGPLVVAAISDATGRDLEVRGDVEVKILSWKPHLRVEQVYFGNADWSNEEHMLEVGRFHISLALRRLLRGDLVFPRIRIEDTVARLEERADGSNNWTFGAADAEDPAPDERSEMPGIRRLHLRNTRVIYTKEGAPQSNVDLDLDTATGRLSKRVNVVAEGRYQKLPARLTLRAGSIAELNDESRPFPLDIAVTAGDTSAMIDGQLVGARDGSGVDATMKVEGDSLSRLYPLIGVVFPQTPPYSLSGRLAHEGEVWTFTNFEGRLGDSDMSGDIRIDLAPERPKMTADFRSKKLDFDDLGPLVGAPPATGPGETASAEQRAEAAAGTGDGRVIPDDAVDVPRLHAMDIDGRLRAEKVIAPTRLPIDKLDLNIKLENGTLRTTPAAFDVAGGRVNLFSTLYSDRQPLRMEADLHARNLLVERILGDTPFTEETRGRLGGDIKLAMRGGSLREMASTADGKAQLAMADAQVSHLLMELIGLDIMKSIGVLLKGDEPLFIRCAAFDLTAENGKARSELFVIDTKASNITADLKLDLATEHLDLTIEPHPKDVSLLALRQALRVEGPLENLDVYPDPLKLGPVGSTMQKVNFLLAPVVGLLTPFDLDTEKGDNGCGHYLREMQGRGPQQASVGGTGAGDAAAPSEAAAKDDPDGDGEKDNIVERAFDKVTGTAKDVVDRIGGDDEKAGNEAGERSVRRSYPAAESGSQGSQPAKATRR
ncbi:MAG TPA: AsmA family protein [Candidatus Limnocylindrales bacterium]|nr:AsmA family protein [Candidatus Limnocylindrales bacterium]